MRRGDGTALELRSIIQKKVIVITACRGAMSRIVTQGMDPHSRSHCPAVALHRLSACSTISVPLSFERAVMCNRQHSEMWLLFIKRVLKSGPLNRLQA